MRCLILFVSLVFLSACRAPHLEPFTLRDYRDEPPVALRVADIRIDDQAPVFTKLPHIEKRMPVSPAAALRGWIETRFRPAAPDSRDTATFIIREASMTQETKPSGSWYVLNNTVYTLTYQLDVHYSRNGRLFASQSVSGWEKQGLPKKSSSLAEKEAAWQKMLNAMLEKTNDKILSDLPPDIRLN